MVQPLPSHFGLLLLLRELNVPVNVVLPLEASRRRGRKMFCLLSNSSEISVAVVQYLVEQEAKVIGQRLHQMTPTQ